MARAPRGRAHGARLGLISPKAGMWNFCVIEHLTLREKPDAGAGEGSLAKAPCVAGLPAIFSFARGIAIARKQSPVLPFETMQKPKFTARIDNIYFLARVGSSLRWAAQGVRPEDLSSDVKHMLERLDQLDAMAQRLSRPNNDRA